MKKKRSIGIALMLLPFFAGCGFNDGQGALAQRVEQYALQTSGIEEEETYAQYVELKEAEELDEAGYYIDSNGSAEGYQIEQENTEEAPEETPQETKQIRVTLARNGYLAIDYFYDKDMTEPIESNVCYLDPGESIYASLREKTKNAATAYRFKEYRVFEYDEEGDRKERPELTSTTGTAIADEIEIALTVPEDFTGTELSVEPVGEYQKREVRLNAYRINPDGSTTRINNGQWLINGVGYADDTVSIAPSESYQVTYQFDEKTYYAAESSPEWWSEKEGEITFREVQSFAEVDEFFVGLHPYLSLEFVGDESKITGVMIGSDEIAESDRSQRLETLKAGDKVSLKLSEGYRLFSNQTELEEPEVLENSVHQYTFTMPDLSREALRLFIGKTNLKIALDHSVGADLLFDIETNDAKKTAQSYKSQTLNTDATIFDEIIGLNGAIKITAREDPENGDGNNLQAGQALRLNVTKTDNNKTKTTETYYIKALPETAEIALYKGALPENYNRWYQDIQIEVLRVDKVVEYQAKQAEHATVTAKRANGSGEELKDGDVVEGSDKITVTITPQTGYYIAGSKTSDMAYQTTLTGDKYLSQIDKILKEHPAKRLIQVTLDTEDAYGDCRFKLDGKEVSGTVTLREDQKLVLEYTLTTDGYTIKRTNGGITDMLNNTFRKKNESVTIALSDELNGTTISRADYITVEKK